MKLCIISKKNLIIADSKQYWMASRGQWLQCMLLPITRQNMILLLNAITIPLMILPPSKEIYWMRGYWMRGYCEDTGCSGTECKDTATTPYKTQLQRKEFLLNQYDKQHILSSQFFLVADNKCYNTLLLRLSLSLSIHFTLQLYYYFLSVEEAAMLQYICHHILNLLLLLSSYIQSCKSFISNRCTRSTQIQFQLKFQY